MRCLSREGCFFLTTFFLTVLLLDFDSFDILESLLFIVREYVKGRDGLGSNWLMDCLYESLIIEPLNWYS